jgi:hypothetical protein
MTSQPLKAGAFLAGSVLVLSGCAAVGAGAESAARKVKPDPVAKSRSVPDASVARGETPPSTDPPVTAAAAMFAATVDAGEPTMPDLPVVTTRAVTDGSALVNDGRPCSAISSASLGRGALEVQRTGAVSAPLTVRFTTAGAASANGDIEALPTEITIPAGMANASVWVTPAMNIAPPPVHVHRYSSLALTIEDTESYDVGSVATAEIMVRFDIDLFGCETPAPADPAPLAVLPRDT